MTITNFTSSVLVAHEAGPAVPGFVATSVTSLLIGTGTKTFATQSNLAYRPGERVRIVSNASLANYMEGQVSAYSGNSMSVAVTRIGPTASGTLADWSIVVAGEPGSGDLLSTNNLSDLTDAATARENLGLGNLESSGNTLSLNGDVIISHPLTPSALNDPSTIVTIGKGAGVALVPINSTQYLTLGGFNSGASIVDADHITAYGAWTLSSYVSGPTPAGITAIGVDSQRALTSGRENTTVGEHTYTMADTFSYVTAMGYNAGLNVGGNYNTFYGHSAGRGSVGMTGDYNVALGPFALNGISGTGTGNIGVGAFAGANITTGLNNIVIGRTAGNTTLETGNNNILIGVSADTPTASTNNYLNIGGIIKGDATLIEMPGDLDFGGSAYTVTSPTPTAASGAFTTVTGSVREKKIGKTVHLQITVVVAAVGTAATQILVAAPTAALNPTAGCAINQSNGSVVMAQIVGASVQIVPAVGTISNNTYLANLAYECA